MRRAATEGLRNLGAEDGSRTRNLKSRRLARAKLKFGVLRERGPVSAAHISCDGPGSGPQGPVPPGCVTMAFFVAASADSHVETLLNKLEAKFKTKLQAFRYLDESNLSLIHI